ncbi:MAG TPA: hypothetical protein VM243_11470 [Phycisphaerae bacterium]|nr:hypothetical protein [Phycisphaerae bacterium]
MMWFEDLPQSVGGVELWWVQRPPAPRTTVRRAVGVAGVFIPLCIAAVVWAHYATHNVWDLWSWAYGDVSPPFAAMRYLLIIAVALLYALLRSLPAWARGARTARSDLAAAEELARAGRWREAGLHLHRHCLLWCEVWSRVPDQVRRLDNTIRAHLRPRRRLYIYYLKRPPALPETPEAGFAPRVAPAAVVRWWTVPVFLVLLATAYNELSAVLGGQPWYGLRAVNFLLLAVLVVAYSYLQVITVLGRRHYFRFAPGVAQYLTFGIIGRRAKVQAIDLRNADATLDLTGPSVILATIPSPPSSGSRCYHLARRADVIEACLRAALSTAAVREMPTVQLVD